MKTVTHVYAHSVTHVRAPCRVRGLSVLLPLSCCSQIENPKSKIEIYMSSQPPTLPNSIRSTIPVEIRDDSCNSCLDFISSDESLDRYNEIISASGWKLDNYLRNPVFQNAHQYGDILFTLGRALVTEVRTVAGGKALFQRIEFACDMNPMAKIAYGLYKGKFLNAVSVGFVPLRWEDGSPAEEVGRGVPTAPSSVQLSTLNLQPSTKQFRRRYLEQELLEVSAVGIPANPNALALGLKSGAIQKSDLRDLSDLIHLTLQHHSSDPTSPTRPTGPSPHLIQMAKQLHSLLRS
jgi:uncharacterized protein